MKKTPDGWPRISAGLHYEDASTAIDWLCRVFGFEVRLKIEGEGGRIEHSELMYGEGLIMIGTAGEKPGRADSSYRASPRSLDGANTQSLCVFVDDVDAHCKNARAEGAKITVEPVTEDYGDDYWSDRSYQAEDLEGHRWWFLQRIRG